VLSDKIFNKIKRIFPVNSEEKLYLPIIDNLIDLENFLKFYPNELIISLPNYEIHSKVLKHKYIADYIIKKKIDIKVDFFGISSKIHLRDVTKTIVFIPNTLALNLLNFVLDQLYKLLTQPNGLLIVISNSKQSLPILNWLEKNNLQYSKARSHGRIYYVIPEFCSSTANQTNFEDYIFKIEYKKKFGEFEFISSDGVFSKDKVDDGTDFLIDTILNEELISENAEVIDYFSGIGVLGLILSKELDLKETHFIESDLISLYLLKKNILAFQVNNVIVHEINGLERPTITPKTIDFIVANPPTHIKKADFKTFLRIAKYLLKPQGKLIMVINKIIPYERTLKSFFPNPSRIIIYSKNKYKVIAS
jgi:16S rRNA (guanine1207-N2)-methyltransferase